MKTLRILLVIAIMLVLLTEAPTASAGNWDVIPGTLSDNAVTILSAPDNAGLTARKLTVDGIPLYEVYRDNGQPKPLVICLHGDGGCKENFFGYACRFANQGFFAVAIDTAGKGDSQAGPFQYAVKAWEMTVSQIDTLIEYYSTVPQADAQHFALFGNSMGACITYAYVSHGRYRPTAIVPMKGEPDFSNMSVAPEVRDFALEYSPMNHPESFRDLYIYAGNGLSDEYGAPLGDFALERWLTEDGGTKHFFNYYLYIEHRYFLFDTTVDFDPFEALHMVMVEGREPLTLSGTVTDENGRPLADVKVSAGGRPGEDGDGGAQNGAAVIPDGRSVRTDENGAFSIAVMTRNGILSFELPGYVTQTHIVSENDLPLNVCMELMEGSVPITELYFQDNVFRAYISQVWDTDNSGALDENEIALAETVDLTIDERLQNNMVSLEGIQYFAHLKRLIASNMPLLVGSVDFSHNTALESIDVSNSGLTGIRLGNLPELLSLKCRKTRPDTLDLRGCPKLRELNLDACALEALDLRANRLLELLICSGNGLSALDLSQNPELKWLSCNHNPLKSLNLKSNSNLEGLAVFNTDIADLDLSGNPALRSLSAQCAPIPVLDISPCPNLIGLLDETLYQDMDDCHLYETGTGNTDSRLFYSKTTLLKTSADQRFNILTLPAGLKRIEEEAFAGIAADIVIVPPSCENVGSRAFANCPNLHAVYAPEGAVFAEDAFADSDYAWVSRTAG